MSATILYPTFADAQYLFNIYSPIENVSILYNNLQNRIDKSYLTTLNKQNIHDIYNEIIIKYYPNEISIKSAFIKKVLLKGKRHVTIFELPVGQSRADLCKINGTSIAYEIKTDLDNFLRLEKQLNDYKTIFEEIYVICSEKNYSIILSLIPSSCGIYLYRQTKRGNYQFSLARIAQKSNEYVPLSQLKTLKKNELQSFFKIDKTITNRSELYDIILTNYDTAYINRIFKEILKQRFEKQWNFLRDNHDQINEIDYQWFYKNQINPEKIYNN